MTLIRLVRRCGVFWALLLASMALAAQTVPRALPDWLERKAQGRYCGIDGDREKALTELQRRPLCQEIRAMQRSGRGCIHVNRGLEAACAKTVGGQVRRPLLLQSAQRLVLRQAQPLTSSFGTDLRLIRLRGPGQCEGSINREVAQQLNVKVLLKPALDDDAYEFACSVAQVADNLYLTAAHCVARADADTVAFADDAEGTASSPPQNDDPKQLVCSWPEFPPADFWDSLLPASANDIAVCWRAADPKPGMYFSGMTPLTEWAKLNSVVNAGVGVVLSGAGIDDSGQTGRVVYGRADFRELPEKDPEVWPVGYPHFWYMGLASAGNLCQAFAYGAGGDSGGPVFDTEGPQRRLLGVISSSDHVRFETFFVPTAKKRVCEFLQRHGALPPGQDCRNAGP